MGKRFFSGRQPDLIRLEGFHRFCAWTDTDMAQVVIAFSEGSPTCTGSGGIPKTAKGGGLRGKVFKCRPKSAAPPEPLRSAATSHP